MKNLYNTLFKSSNIVKNCTRATLMLCISFVAVSADAKIKDKANKTTVLTSVAADTEYNFSGDVKLNKLTLDNTILNIADGKTLKLNNDVSVKGENSAINAPTINLGSKTLTVSDGSKLSLSGTVSSGNGGNINLGNSGTLAVESGKTLNLAEDITLSSGIVDLAGTLVGNLNNATLNLVDKDADFSGVNFENVDFKISTPDYNVTENIGALLNIGGVTNINLENTDSLKVDAGSELNLGQKTLSGGVVDLAGTIIGNLKDTTLNLTNKDADFSSAVRDNVAFKVSDKEYDIYSLVNVPDVTNVTFAADFDEKDMAKISQKFLNVDNLSFEEGTYNITESINFYNDSLTLGGGRFEITDADLENSNDFSILGGTLTATSSTGNNEIEAANGLLSISGGSITADAFEFTGHNGVEISGGEIVLNNDSEIASSTETNEIPYLTISGGNITLNHSYLLARSDIETKGIINITGGNITVNEGFIGAFNYSDGGIDENHLSEGGQINISGGTITFNGGNSIDDPIDWVGDDDGYFIANEILAQNINVGGDAQINISEGAHLKTTILADNSDSIDFANGASLIRLSDNSTLNLSGALRANINKGFETAGTLNINDSDARIIGDVSGVNLAINSDFTIKDHLNGVVNDLGDVTLADGKTLELVLNGDLTGYEEDLNMKSFTMGQDSILKIMTSDYTPDMNRDFEAHGPIQVTGTIEIAHGGLKLDSQNIAANFDMEDANATIFDGDVVARSDGGNMNFKNSDIKIEFAGIEKVYGGNLNITDGSTITLSQKGEVGAIISKQDTNSGNHHFIPSTLAGDINISDSIINMNAHSAILRGDGELNIVDGKAVFDEEIPAKGNGSININNSTINMNDYSVIAMNNLDPTQGTVNIKNGSVLNVNGDNKILTDAIIEVKNSVININQDSVLSLQKEDVRPEDGGTIHLGHGSVINLFGTLNGNLVGDANDSNKAGTLNLMSDEADVTGIAHWLNLGLQTNMTFIGEDIFIYDLTVGSDDQKPVQLIIDGDNENNERASGIIDSLTIKDGASVLAKTTTAEWEQTGELDSPIRHNIALNISKVQVDEGGILELNGNGNHSVEISDVKTATINGTLKLVNGRLEGSDEDPSSTISIDGADIHMSGISNIEAGGAITINNSLLDMDIDDHGIVSSTSLDINASSITLSGSNPAEFGNGHLIAYKGFDDVSGDLNIRGNSTINMMGANLLSGEKIAISDSELNIQGNDYIISHQNDINIQNSSLTIGDGKTLSVLTGKDLAEIDDENYPTIVEAYQALNPKYGNLNIRNNSILNLSGKLYSDAYIDNSTLNINSKNAFIHGTTTLSNSSVLNLGTNKLTTDTFEVNSGATVNFTVANSDTYGSVKANKASIGSENTTLNLTLNNGVIDYNDETGITVKVIDADNFSGSFGKLNEVNNRYGFKDLGDGNYQIYGLGNSAASIVASVGGSSETQAVATAWLDTENSGVNTEVLNHLETLAQVNASGFTKAIETLQPEATSVRVEATTSNNLQIANATTTRLNNLASVDTIGRSAGDTALQSNLWVQGLHNKSKLDRANGFSGKTYGIAMGFDTKPSDDTIIGIGYAYTQTDLDAIQKDTDIESHTAMLYGQKTIYDAFINAIVTYGFNKYDETRTNSEMRVSADYDMDSVFTQVMTGYNFNLGLLKITPKTGLRYLWTHMHNYMDSMRQYVQSKNTNTFTGIIGTTFTSEFNVQGFTFTPKITLAGTYDLKQDGGSSTVTLANGANYTTRGDTLKRFGIESGIGLNMSYKDFELGIQYEGRFKKDYQDHTGMINFRYNF